MLSPLSNDVEYTGINVLKGVENEAFLVKSLAFKIFIFIVLFRFLAWSIGAQLIIFFCFRFLAVLFVRLGISICHAIRCIC